MKKHAYLIMAHGDWELLNKLLRLLDDSRNDIFLHIDKKSRFDEDNIYTPQNAELTYIPRIRMTWGGDSLIHCTLKLLELASARGYQYYHLLSGSDLPLKSQDEIHAFFDAHNGQNFMSFDYKAMNEGTIQKRVSQYHLLQNVIGRSSGHIIALVRILEERGLQIQRLLRIDRTKTVNLTFYKGAEWFSITHDMVLEILKEKTFIQKYCYKSLCADEIFIQTIAMNSNLVHTIVNDDLRFIDWNRGSPYTYRMCDFDLLMGSNKLFARKFNSSIDVQVIDKIVDIIG